MSVFGGWGWGGRRRGFGWGWGWGFGNGFYRRRRFFGFRRGFYY